MIKFTKKKKVLFSPIIFIVILFSLSFAAEVPAVATENTTNAAPKINVHEIIKNKKEEFSSKLIDNFSKISESKNNEAEKEVIIEETTIKKAKTTNAKSKITKKKEKKKATIKKENTDSQSQESAEQLMDSQPQKEVENNENSLQQEDAREEIKENDTSSNAQSENDIVETNEDNINNDELMLLAKLIYLENGSNTDLAQLLTGNVVLNRVASSKYPNTIKGVIYQKGQYSVVSKINETTPSDRAIKNAKRLLSGERFCPENVIYQSRFKQGSGVYEKINGEYFCYA